MRLGYQDKASGSVYEFKKHDGREDLFNKNNNYAQCFFDNVRGLGNVFLVKIKGNNVHRIANRKF